MPFKHGLKVCDGCISRFPDLGTLCAPLEFNLSGVSVVTSHRPGDQMVVWLPMQVVGRNFCLESHMSKLSLFDLLNQTIPRIPMLVFPQLPDLRHIVCSKSSHA